MHLPAGLRQTSPEVLYAEPGIVTANGLLVATLKSLAEASPRRRARLCAHPAADAHQQEMLIVMHRDGYVRPHRHRAKTETFTVFEGEADALLFDETGAVTDVLHMGTVGSGRLFFYRMPEGVFHSLVLKTEWIVFLETTLGPFDPSMSQAALWAPPESELEEGRDFLVQAVNRSRMGN
jgi:cupin fold WbuC family metalloprotein